ncbi:MAG: type IV pilin N-terminal domain-containing protein [Nanoarchaeota archaeon]
MKRGVSPVVATVLLLVITVALISVLAAFVIPFVRNSLDGGSDCFETINKLTLVGTDYACLDASGTTELTGISVQRGAIDIEGFTLILHNAGSATPYKITEDGDLGGVIKMLGASDNVLNIPAKGGLRTYVATGSFSKIEVAPIIGSKSCDVSDSIDLVPCEEGITLS